MKIYEKPMAIINEFEIEDIIANSIYNANSPELNDIVGGTDYQDDANDTQGIVFQW